MGRVVEIIVFLNVLGGAAVTAARWHMRRRRESHKEHVQQLLRENQEIDTALDKMKRGSP